MTDIRPAGYETVRGTRCRVVAARAGSAEFTIWIDDEHIRRVRSVWNVAGKPVSVTRTLELWDFGAADGSADWTRLPDFRTAGHSPEPAS